jgi:hypothetical protein
VKDGRVPLYCFFNFAHTSIKFGSGGHCHHPYRAPSYWGCALALPQAVKAAPSNSVNDLRPVMQPWHMLVCDGHSGDLLNTAASFIGTVYERAQQQNRSIEAPQFEKLRGPIPDYVARLVDLPMGQAPAEGIFLDYAYWDREDAAPDGIGGIVVFDDKRDL